MKTSILLPNTNTIFSKMESIYEELFHLFKLNTHLSSKSHKSKWLSTIEKIGLMETKNLDSYIIKNPQFTKTFGDASKEMITKIQENEYFTIKDQTLSFKFMEKDNDESMRNLLFSTESDNNNLSKWKKWVGFR